MYDDRCVTTIPENCGRGFLKVFFAAHLKTISTCRQNRVYLLLLFDNLVGQLFGLFKAGAKGERTQCGELKLINFVNQVVGYKH